MIAEAEIWQVMCGREVYQADLDTLKQWVVEGLVLPTDQVRKGNLRWLDAARVPALRAVFSGEETPAPMMTQPQHAHQPPPAHPQQHAPQPNPYAPSHPFAPPQAAPPFLSQTAATVVDGVYRAAPDAPAQPAVAAHAGQAHAGELYTGEILTEDVYAGFAPQPSQQPAADPFFPPAPEEAEREAPFVPDPKEFAARTAAPPIFDQLVVCYEHPYVRPKFVCRACQTPMCGDCAKYVGASRVALCPLCGDLCKDFAEVRQKAARAVEKARGFGFEDFGRAAVYPFKNILGLVGISVFYSLLSLGGLKGQVLAYVVIFGCMSLVIKQMAWGRFERGFLPDFTAMSLYDDVAVPCFLGLGITLVTIGPAILLFLALLFGVIGGGPSAAEQQAAAVEAQQAEVARHAERVMDPNATQEEVEESAAVLQGRKRGQAAGADEAAAESNAAVVRGAITSVGGSLAIILALLLSLVWAFFYYPMALLVAGYTEDLGSVVNPLVGLDTIRRMGWTYVKAFAMYASVQVAGGVFGAISMFALSGFDMPFVGNIPARFVEGAFSFYSSLVIAAVLGLALYKSSDRLGIETD